MTLIVETGAGLPDADSYASVADADAYHAARGNAAWTGTDAAKESALRRATDYLDRLNYAGTRASAAQALAWPRYDVMLDEYDIAADAVPARVVKAACELALRALSSDLLPDQGGADVTRETVGPVSVEYAPSPSGGRPRYGVVADLLRPLLVGGSRVLRA